MSFVFLSYAREDAALARQLAQYLANQRVDVFWDQQLRHGEDFRSIIRERLEAAACVLVLWSNHSVLSHWVVYEADEGLNRNSLMEARLDDSKPPPPFGILNVADLRGWTGDSLTAELRKLIDSVDSKLQTSGPPVISFAAPRKNQVVTDSHLALIHTCWRSEQHDAEYGQTMYMWDLMLYGSRQALNRVREVTYFLHPSYESQDGRSSSTNRLHHEPHRGTSFRLRQLAYSHSLARAHVSIKDQVELVKLSRYINLFHTEDRIYEYYVGEL